MRKSLLAAFLFIAIFSISKRSEAQSLIHYWNFNVQPAVADTFPNIPLLKASYSVIDTNKAYIKYQPIAGTSVASDDSAWIDNVAGTTLNAQQGAAAGNSLRVRNPSDAMELRIYMPTTNYQNISVSYALETSSTGSGQGTEAFDYSVDSGVTWKTSALTVNGVTADTLNVAQTLYTNFALVTIGFGSDTTVNNTTKLVLRIKFTKQNTGTSGNNRFDNLAVTGNILSTSISILTQLTGDTLLTGQLIHISYATTGTVSNFRAVDLTDDSGKIWNELGISTQDTFSFVIPKDSSWNCFLEVLDENGIVGKSGRFGIFVTKPLPPPPPPPDTSHKSGASTLIHYWNFNNLSATYKEPNVPKIDADYSVLDTSKAYLQYYLLPGTSSTYGVANGSDNLDNVASADTSNLRLGTVSGQALRVRNPVDSVELRWHIPSTGYANLVVKFAVESSSTTSGDSTQVYSYSVDGGTTWKSTGMTVNGANVDTMDVTDNPLMQGTNWGLVTVTFGSDASVNNNPNLIFRIVCRGNTHLLSGNNRYDDFTLDGTPVGAQTLIHYWNFSALSTKDTVPNVPRLKAFYSVIDTNAATIIDTLQPGTSKYYVGWFDNVAGDTTNHQLGDLTTNALRARNPTDSMEILMRMPSTGYKNLVVQYGLESSSLTSGQLVEVFDYSTDGGNTWKNSSLSVQGLNVDTLDVTNPIFQGTSWGLVTVTFGNDSTVNNNPNLVLRVKFRGNNTGTSGNNRFEHVTLEGVASSSAPPPPPPPVPDSIVVTAPPVGDTLLAGTQTTISYTVTSTTSYTRAIDYSTNGGTTWTSVATGVTSLSYIWTVPSTPASNVLVRVKDTTGVIGMSGKFVIVVPGTVDSVWISSSPVVAGLPTNVEWRATGYLGNTFSLNVYYDGVTPNLLENGSAAASGNYIWSVPDAQIDSVFIRITFASGATGRSAPFNIVVPADVSQGSNAGTEVQVWPNPFRTQATLQYDLVSSENVSLSIHDLVGRDVESIPEGMQEAGTHEITIDGSQLPDGVYLYELTAGSNRYHGQLVIVR